MAKGNNQKLKLLYMAKIFSEKTDENHGISVQEMISLLNQYEVNADRKTIYLDFEELRHFGMDIVSNQEGRNVYYRLVSRDFELPELRHDGAWYHISPWALVWDDENYYLIGFDSESSKIKHYRVDKMMHLGEYG